MNQRHNDRMRGVLNGRAQNDTRDSTSPNFSQKHVSRNTNAKHRKDYKSTYHSNKNQKAKRIRFEEEDNEADEFIETSNHFLDYIDETS